MSSLKDSIQIISQPVFGEDAQLVAEFIQHTLVFLVVVAIGHFISSSIMPYFSFNEPEGWICSVICQSHHVLLTITIIVILVRVVKTLLKLIREQK